MGKGDIRSKKGKRFAGSFGNSRPQKVKSTSAASVVPKVATEKTKSRRVATKKA